MMLKKEALCLRIAGFLSGILGLIVLIGWYTHSTILIQVLPSFVPMQYNTALGFFFSGIGLIAASYRWEKAVFFTGSIVGMIGFLTLLQYIFFLELGIDQLFMEHYVTVKTFHPGRMAPNTAISFFLSAIALLLLSRKNYYKKIIKISGTVSSIIFALGSVALFGYLSGLETAYGWGHLTRMALHTSAGFVIIGLGLVVFSWITITSNKDRFSLWVVIPVFFGTITIAISLWQAITAKANVSDFFSGVVLVVGLLQSFLISYLVYFIQIARKNENLLKMEMHERKNTEKELEKQTHIIKERIKELNCLYGISKLVEQENITLDNILHGIVCLIPPSWQYPDITCAKLTLTDNEYKTDNFKDTKWKQSADIKVSGEKIGFLEVYYIEEMHEIDEDPFLKEERNLIDAVAERIGKLMEANLADKKIQELNENLERRVIERTAQLDAVNEELNVANKELEAFSYSVSHDLRAPLRAINGFSRILLEDHSDKLDGEGERVVNVICRNARKMGNLIDDLLEFSRIGRKKVRMTRINMEQLAEAIFEELKTSVTERNLRLKLNTLPYAYGDEPMIREVMGNLISNAIKFTCFKDTAVIEVGGKEENDEILYYVKDNGAGFDMKYVDKLFGVFQSLHSSEDFEGTGVGLALVKRIIDKHGGRVRAEGKVDDGATFYFTLPKKGELNNEQ